MSENKGPINSLVKPGEQMDWVSLYEKVPVETLPWYSKELDKELSTELDTRGLKSGKFLDLGTGPGTQAIELAKRGFDVTGSDISGPGIEKARKRAGDLGHIRFVVDDIMSSRITETFDYIFDRGCFHVFEPEVYDSYLKNVCRLLRRDGLLFLKCFAEGEEMDSGPKCFNQARLEDIFSNYFKIILIRPSEFLPNTTEGGEFPKGIKALFTIMQRL
jgi:SAM-dependent methyltransferase